MKMTSGGGGIDVDATLTVGGVTRGNYRLAA